MNNDRKKLSFFVQWHIKLYGLFNVKALRVKEHQWYY